MNLNVTRRNFVVCFLSALLVACDSPPQSPRQSSTTTASLAVADSVYLNGRIYTVDEAQEWVGAIAIKDGSFLHVGSSAQVKKYIGAGTEVVDLDGRFVMPGMFDSHLHPLKGMAQQMFECNFSFMTSLEDAAMAVKKCADDHPDWPWIVGGQWNAAILSKFSPTKEMLDAVVADRPVYLSDATFHHAWVNSKALELAGITKETPDSQGSTIIRDKDSGEIVGTILEVGTLLETVSGLFDTVLPKTSVEQYRQAALAIQQRMNSYGFTGMKSAITPREHLQALHQLDSDDHLTLRVAAHLSYVSESASPKRAMILESIIRDRNNYTGKNLNADFIKITIDGVPPSHTAAYLEAYLDKADYYGELLVAQNELNAAAVRFDGMGLLIKFHAAGDAAARAAINAIEAARKQNGDSGIQHEVAHASLIDADDIVRLAKLGGAVEVSPVLWYPSPFITARYHALLGAERVNRLWPVKTYVESGLLTVAGSDWPAAVASPDPWPAMEALITRKNPFGEMPGEIFGEANAVDLATVIRMYTRNGAEAMRISENAGSIEVGKSADMIVLDRNLFEIPADDIDQTEVELTIFTGKLVYRRES